MSPLNPSQQAEKRRMQSELGILEADFKKSERMREEIEMEKRIIKKKEDQIKAELLDKDQRLKKIERDQFMLQGEINMLKKKINSLI